MRFISRSILILLLNGIMVTKAYATFGLSMGVGSQWGMGAYGLGAPCGFNMGSASGSISELDEIAELNEELDRLKDLQKDFKAKLREIDRKMAKDRAAINAQITSPGVAQEVINHIEVPMDCDQHNPVVAEITVRTCTTSDYDTKDGHRTLKETAECTTAPAPKSTGTKSGMTKWDWTPGAYCRGLGKVNPAVCITFGKGSGYSQCSQAVDDLAKQRADKEAAETELNNLNSQIDSIKDQKTSLMRDAKRSLREAYREGTEGGCAICNYMNQYRPQKTDGWNILGGLVAGGIGAGLGYLAMDNAIDSNAKMGFPTNPSQGYGWPMGMMLGSMALYGAIQGGANGGFGCNNGLNSAYGPGGLMGYPNSMYPGAPGGGMFMNPMMSMMNPYMMNSMNPYAMNPMMSSMLNPFMSNPMMNPMMNSMNPFMSNPMMSSMMNPFSMNPYMSNPMMSSMMNPYSMGNMFDPMSMFGGNGYGNMQLQQQQMAMQMQQYSMMMDQQRQLQDAAISRQRTMSNLYSELQSLMFRINQVQMGVGLGVDISTPTNPFQSNIPVNYNSSAGSYYPSQYNGNNYFPMPGGTNYQTGTSGQGTWAR